MMTPGQIERKKKYEAIAKRYLESEDTQKEIGEAFGLSGARVSQILYEQLGPEFWRMRPAARPPTLDDIKRAYFAGGVAGVYRRRAMMQEWRKLPKAVRHQWRRERNTLSGAHYRSRVYSRKDMVRALLQASKALGSHVSIKKYRVLARKHGLPSVAIITNEFGSWNAAKTEAKLRAKPRIYRNGKPAAITRQECLEAVAAVAMKLGYVPSIEEYTKTATDTMPSACSIRNVLSRSVDRNGRWLYVVDKVQEYLSKSAVPV